MAKEDILKARTDKLKKKFNSFKQTEFIGTGSLILDVVMGGGLPVGKMIELASEAGIGKTTITLSMCRNLLEQGKRIIYLDHEGAITTSQLEGIGVQPYLNSDDNPDGTFFLYQVSTYEEAEEVIDNLAGTGQFSLIVIDSVAAMINSQYLTEVMNPDSKDKSISVAEVRPAIDARVLGVFMKKYKAVCMKFNVSMILINQLRTALSLTGGPSMLVTTGGKALEFYPDIRLRLERPQILYQKKQTINGLEDTPVGCDATIYASKNKMTNAKIKVPLTVIFGRGISNIKSYMKWLPSKMTKFNGEEVPMLQVKGGGYNTITLNNQQYPLRGEEAIINFITEHFEDIRKCFSYKDFEITEKKDYAEFKADGGSIYSETPGESFVVDDALGGIESDYDENENQDTGD